MTGGLLHLVVVGEMSLDFINECIMRGIPHLIVVGEMSVDVLEMSV